MKKVDTLFRVEQLEYNGKWSLVKFTNSFNHASSLLNDSPYLMRVVQCKRGRKVLSRNFNHADFFDLTKDQLEVKLKNVRSI